MRFEAICDDFVANIVFDEAGFVVDYPRMVRRITPSGGERRLNVRQVNVSTLVTLDGVLEDPGGAERAEIGD